jgi:hypothetical protein
VDIKSKYLKVILKEVLAGVKGISMVEETPSISPQMLFIFLEDLRKVYKDLKKKNIVAEEKEKKKKLKQENKTKRQHLHLLIKYLDTDYAATKKALYPMLESGLITYELLWALWKPNSLACTTTYGSIDEPRAFKIDGASAEESVMKGAWYSITGRYLEYDGKHWGMGTSPHFICSCLHC